MDLTFVAGKFGVPRPCRDAADFAVDGAWKSCYGGDAFGQAAVVGDDGAQACRYGVGVYIASFYH